MGFYTRTLKDYDSETTTFRVNANPLNAGNIAAELVLQSNLGAAINDMVLGSLQQITYGNAVTAYEPAPNVTEAQRELKWMINYRDSVLNTPHHVTLGTADTSRLDPNNRGKANMGDAGVVDAFVAAFEAYAVSPAGNPVTVESIILVGRNV